MAFARTGDIAVHYQLDGPADAPVLMLSNSIGTSLAIWNDVVAELADNYRVLRYDMRGHGLTDAPPGPYTMAQLAGDCVSLLDRLDIQRAHFCGLSIGGMVAQQLAASFPDRLERLILCDTGMRIGTSEMWQQRIDAIQEYGLDPMADNVLQRWFTERFRSAHPAATAGYRNMLARTPADGYAAACAAIRDADLTPACASIAAPTLVVCGDQDIATPPEMASELAQTIPEARATIINGAAHLPCVEQPQALAREIRAFLEEDSHG